MNYTYFTFQMEFLYVLQLADGKYYVGKTADVKRRVEEHMKGGGSEWTKIHKPVKVVETRRIKDEHDENNTTKDYMKKYGIDNVRGGSYSQVSLPSSHRSVLTTEFRGNSNACFRCGNTGHYARDCDAEGDNDSEDNDSNVDDCDDEDDDFDDDSDEVDSDDEDDSEDSDGWSYDDSD